MKISIIGIGRVGSTIAYALGERGLCDELLLVNRRHAVAVGEAMDLQHTLPFWEKTTTIQAAAIAETAGSDIVILCASASLQDVQSRADYGPANAALYRELMPPVIEASSGAIYLVVANPVDVLTYILIKEFGLSAERVFGSGTIIDSARFRYLLSQHYSIHPQDMRAYILGEHGETQFAVKSNTQAGGERIADEEVIDRLFQQALDAGMDVWRAKGYTNYAIASAVSMIIETIVNDERHTMPLSILLEDYTGVSDVCLSVPVVLGARGIARVLHPSFSENEVAQLQYSAASVKQAIAKCCSQEQA